MKLLKKTVLLIFVSLPGFMPARADTIFGEFKRLPDVIERGITLGADFGLLFLTGNNLETAENPGFGLSINAGMDLFKYVSIEGICTMGINQAAVASSLRGSVNTILLNIAAKGQYPMGRLYPFFETGAGIHMSYPEFGRGNGKGLALMAAGGLEYYTYLRHYSLYAKMAYVYSKLPPDIITVSAGIKYTF